MTACAPIPCAGRVDGRQPDGRPQRRHATFTGNVVIGQGDLRLSAAKAVVTYAAAQNGKAAGAGGQGKISSFHATEQVTLASPRKRPRPTTPSMTSPTSTVTLTGDVLLTQGANTIAGQKLVVDLTTGVGTMEGRVRTTLTPGKTASGTASGTASQGSGN